MLDNYFMCRERELANGVCWKMVVRNACFRHSKRFVYVDVLLGKVNFNNLSEFSGEAI